MTRSINPTVQSKTALPLTHTGRAILATLALFPMFATSPALAGEVVIRDQRCVGVSADATHASITAYDAYVNVPGAKYEMNLGLSRIPLLKMTKSQARYGVREGDRTDALVLVELKPTNLTDPNLYPRFYLRCESARQGEAQFAHQCSLVQHQDYAAYGLRQDARRPYGLAGFASTLSMRQGTSACPQGTELNYELRLLGNSADVAEIKAAVLAPAGVLAPVLDSAFNEETFFRSYYQNFYDSWARTLR